MEVDQVAQQTPWNAVLTVDQITRDFGTPQMPIPVLHGISLTLFAGELACLIGPSGSGKSTLLNILGLLDKPTSGVVLVGETEASSLGDDGLTALRGAKLGFIFQFHHLLPAFTATENVMLPLMAKHGRAQPWMRERAIRLLERVGLSNRLHYKPAALSGGQQQRVAIARALASEPLLVLADEPTGNLDTQASEEVFALLRELTREKGMALLVVTHDPRIAARADRIIEIVDGRIHQDTRKAAPMVGQCGLPCPYPRPECGGRCTFHP